MRILIICSGYLPGTKYGGPVSSIYNFTELLGGDFEVFIVCSDHDLQETLRYESIGVGWNKVGKAAVKYVSDVELNYRTYNLISDEVQPDLIYVSSLFSVDFNSPVYRMAHNRNIPILLAPRGELNPKALSTGKIKKKLYIQYLKLTPYFKDMFFQATSDAEFADIISVLNVNKDKVLMLPNIPSLPEKKNDLNKQSRKNKMCFVGRIVPNKKLDVCLEALKNVESEVSLDIYGSKEDIPYWEKCRRIIEEEPSNVTITYCGVVNQLKIRALYKNYDCLISPTQFENYGQAIVEAMLHDTPVIISEHTTPWDNIREYGAGFVVPLGDINGFSKAINAIGNMDTYKYRELVSNLRCYINDTFDYDTLKRAYISTINEIIG